MEEKHGLTVALVAGKDLLPLAEDVKLLLFESVRELLLNVVKHAGVRSAKVDLRCVGGTAMRITVEDSGRGFDPAIPRKVGAPGGGLGIFGITERLDLIGGQMQIESAPGQGSRFILTVPTRTAAAPAAGSETRSLPLGERSRREARPAEGFRVRVLLADDHAVMREGLAGLLGQESGFEVVGQASDGQAAIELARRLMPDVILMDLAMPGINGVEATRIIHGEMPWMKIVGLSMHDEPERSKVMREAGAAGYLTKSSDPQDIIRAVRECGIADVPRLPAGVRAARPRAKRAPRK
jgi:CheY-like chemotaxis protein/anti-sigma regulatory factor (Ser/Thr protein kinase)